MLTIEEIKEKVRPICERYKIDRMWVFALRNRKTDDDGKSIFVGLYIEGGVFRGWEYGGVYGDLERALNAQISLAESDNQDLPKQLRQQIMENEVLVYER